MIAGVWFDDGNLRLEATTHFQKLLSIERNPPIEEVIQSGVVQRFIEFLGRDDYPQLQSEAAWALTNIASGTSEYTKVVIDHGVIPIFVRLLTSPSDDVREQQRFSIILWLFHCFLGLRMLVVVLCNLKILLDKLLLGIQPYRQAYRPFFWVSSHFLVNHMDPPLFELMPQRPLLLVHITQTNRSTPSLHSRELLRTTYKYLTLRRKQK